MRNVLIWMTTAAMQRIVTFANLIETSIQKMAVFVTAQIDKASKKSKRGCA